jgi:hypothetical protein
MLWPLLLCIALAGWTLAQEEKAPTTHAAPGKSSRDPLSPKKGGTRVKTSAGGHATTANRGPSNRGIVTRSVSLKGGGSVRVRKNGSIRSLDRQGLHIEHGIHGGRTVSSMHNGALVVSTGPSGGYVQRAYVTRGGRSYYSRTYYDHGVYRVAAYRSYFYGGRVYYSYYPSYWYHPAFYAWAYNAWPAPVYWGIGAWGWGGAPWWGYYAGYFTPYPVYASPAFWLTDDLLASNLQAEYAVRAEAHAESAAADAEASSDSATMASTAVTLTPEVKQAIADEIKMQLAAQQAAAQNSASPAAATAVAAPAQASEVLPALDPQQRTFVVSSEIAVAKDGTECSLTAGDVVTRLTDTPDADQSVNASVAASKKGDCAAGTIVAIQVDDLQEMYNHFEEQLANGLAELAKKQGTGGMPKAPDAGTMASDVPPPAPDTTAVKALQDQQAEADRAESQVKEQLAAASGGSG